MPESHWETMEYLNSIGFRTNPNNKLVADIDEAKEYYHSWVGRRESLPYEADGIVIKVDALSVQEELGTVGNEPRGAIAYKFPAVQGTTTLNEIGISVGRTGTLNPYAILEPVRVGGVTIRQAALHNEDDIRRKDIREGDRVYIQRAGEVIPEVVGPTPDSKDRPGRNPPFDLLAKTFNSEKGRPACPVCGAEVIRHEGEAMYFCTNARCPAQLQARLELFASRGAMDIRGIGESMSATLLERELVHDVADLYYHRLEDLLKLERTGEKSARNVMTAIERSKDRPVARLLYGLGIRHVGSQMSEVLADKFRSMDELLAASEEELITVSAIGRTIADSVVAFFRQEDNRLVIEKLRKAGVRLIDENVETKGEMPLAGLEFVITGTLKTSSRERAQEKIKALGGVAKDDVTRKTSYLVVGSDPGSKLTKAQAWGIKTIDEEEFQRLLQQAK